MDDLLTKHECCVRSFLPLDASGRWPRRILFAMVCSDSLVFLSISGSSLLVAVSVIFFSIPCCSHLMAFVPTCQFFSHLPGSRGPEQGATGQAPWQVGKKLASGKHRTQDTGFTNIPILLCVNIVDFIKVVHHICRVLAALGWRSQQGTWRGYRPEAWTPKGLRARCLMRWFNKG